jgi:hypothetical protein
MIWWELGALRFSGYWFGIIHWTLHHDDGCSNTLAHQRTQVAGDYALGLVDTPSY